jgi:hypothetical protein
LLKKKFWSESVMSDIEEMLQQGSALLSPLLSAHGFTFHVLGSGGSSGGQFAYGEFRRDDRRLEIHFRHSLGMIRYHLAGRSLSHQDYMRTVIGKPNSSHYPGFSSDPLDAFRHLLLDLEEHGSGFLAGSDACLYQTIDQAETQPSGTSKLPD